SAVAEWASVDEESSAERNRHLAAGLLYEIAKDGDKASREYAAALRADPSIEPAVRALISPTSSAGTADLLSGLAEAVSDDVHKALLLIEAALRLGFESDQ